MEHLGTKVLKTSRLTLRPFTVDDAGAMFRNWASDKEVTKTLMWKTHESVEESKDILTDWVKNYDSKEYYQWAIVPDELGEPIGSIAAVKQNDIIKMVHIGYCIGKKWWHNGYMSEALARLMEFFFNEVGINRIESRHDPKNPHSGNVMKKCGMVCEGTSRQADWCNNGITDSCFYALLKEDYMKTNLK